MGRGNIKLSDVHICPAPDAIAWKKAICFCAPECLDQRGTRTRVDASENTDGDVDVVAVVRGVKPEWVSKIRFMLGMLFADLDLVCKVG